MASKSFSSTALSIDDFLTRFPDDQACQDALERTRWPHGFVCPRCEHSSARTFPRSGRKVFECRRCLHQTHPGVGTIFTDTKLPLKTWFFALYLLTQSKTNVAGLELTRHLGVCQRTAWRIKHKIMEAMSRQDAARQLRGFVEIDDAYLGGERNDGIRGRRCVGETAIHYRRVDRPCGSPASCRSRSGGALRQARSRALGAYAYAQQRAHFLRWVGRLPRVRRSWPGAGKNAIAARPKGRATAPNEVGQNRAGQNQAHHRRVLPLDSLPEIRPPLSA